MAEKATGFQEFLREEVNRTKGVYYPVRAGFLHRLTIRDAPVKALHPNPNDEFTFPDIGPNYEIISRYMQDYMRDVQFRRGYEESSILEPLYVQKAKPDGYLILNGHHRWAAAMRAGRSRVRIKIVNLTQPADIRRMLAKSQSSKRAVLDLDEVVFCADNGAVTEKPLRFPLNRFYPEKVRKGIPALLHFFNELDYDVWVFTAKYYSMEYILYFFKHWNVRLTGIVTGTARKGDREATMRELKKMMELKYSATLHVDDRLVFRTAAGSKEIEEYPLSGSPDAWAGEVMDAVRTMEAKRR